MNFRTLAPLAAAAMFAAPMASHAALSAYQQSFEGLAAGSPTALGGDGWLGYANVWNSNGSWAYGYGPFAAPNGGGGFSGIAQGQGGPAQGAQQLSVYSDYNNRGAQTSGQRVEANVFQERNIVAADVGTQWVFKFDAKRGNLEGSSTAMAFIKTLDPNAGYQTTNIQSVDLTSVTGAWGTYSLPFTINANPGQTLILQFGFASTATNDQGSGVFYDNVLFTQAVPEPATYALMLAGLALLGTAARRRRG